MATESPTDPDNIWWHDNASQYPWQSWLNGSLWALTPGQDFTCTVAALQSAAHRIARRYDMRLRTKHDRHRDILYLQVIPGQPLRNAT